MNPSLIRNFSSIARNLLVKSPSPTQSLAPVAVSASNGCKLRHYSTEFDSTDESSSTAARPLEEASSSDVDDVTEEELKRRIQKFYEGDVEAIPSILEGILKRKLAGKNDEDLIEQLPCDTNRGGADSESDDEEDI
ncbi:uncharacterized protein LOC116215673 [Punica granatum]|uniref:Uncharacterized protein n=2 Tax=Punica granatum TaxID=22663 RepID=A0A2I0JUS2_PUNGR|nr:uncharacterized protein LOC116215673 [Punica granatum]PKI60021.1 hypothetical protein CRG98_019609 [Punica granatum]